MIDIYKGYDADELRAELDRLDDLLIDAHDSWEALVRLEECRGEVLTKLNDLDDDAALD